MNNILLAADARLAFKKQAGPGLAVQAGKKLDKYSASLRFLVFLQQGQALSDMRVASAWVYCHTLSEPIPVGQLVVA